MMTEKFNMEVQSYKNHIFGVEIFNNVKKIEAIKWNFSSHFKK